MYSEVILRGVRLLVLESQLKEKVIKNGYLHPSRMIADKSARLQASVDEKYSNLLKTVKALTVQRKALWNDFSSGILEGGVLLLRGKIDNSDA